MKKVIFSLLLFISCSSAQAAEEIIIGLDADMSAVAVEGGIAIARGAQIAIDEINGRGGVLGRKLTLLVKDHRGNPARGVDNIHAFSQMPNVVAVIGGVHTPVAVHELPVIHEQKMLYLGAWAAGTTLVENGYKPNYVFRNSVNDKWAASVMLAHAQKQGCKRLALFLERTSWGRSNEKSLGHEANERGLLVDHIYWFNWGDRDFQATIERAVSQGVDAIVLVANAPEGSAIVKAIADLPEERRIPVISHWGLASGHFAATLGLDAVAKTKLWVLQTYAFSRPHNVVLRDRVLAQYQQRYDANASDVNIRAAVGVAHAYDLVHLLALAITEAGGIDRVKVRDALEHLKFYEGLVKRYAPPFTPTRHDALTSKDYFMAHYDARGYLIPVAD